MLPQQVAERFNWFKRRPIKWPRGSDPYGLRWEWRFHVKLRGCSSPLEILPPQLQAQPCLPFLREGYETEAAARGRRKGTMIHMPRGPKASERLFCHLTYGRIEVLWPFSRSFLPPLMFVKCLRQRRNP